jgi:hypothetical protein
VSCIRVGRWVSRERNEVSRILTLKKNRPLICCKRDVSGELKEERVDTCHDENSDLDATAQQANWNLRSSSARSGSATAVTQLPTKMILHNRQKMLQRP